MSNEETTVRIRGVFATALTHYLYRKGFSIVQPSRIVAERIGLPLRKEPARITVKSLENDPSTILVIGRNPHFEKVFTELKELFKHSFYYKSLIQQYATVIAEVKEKTRGKCIAEAAGIQVIFDTNNCVPGRIVTISITKPPIYPWEKAQGIEGFSILTENLVLTSYKQAAISTHIKDKQRIHELEELSLTAIKENYGIRWRSNASITPIHELKEELQKTINEAKKLEAEIKPVGTIIAKGQEIALITTSRPDKENLDQIRKQTTPTIPHHHTLKTNGDTINSIVDYAEMLAEKNINPELLGDTAFEYTWKNLYGKKIFIYHYSPEGKNIDLGPLKPVTINTEDKIAVFTRKVHATGAYDGLNEKKELGDKITTIIPFSEWFLIHVYENREGKIKGAYININTPPEPGENNIRYLDLHLDIILKPREPPTTIDREKLENAYSRGIIGKSLYEKTLYINNQLINKLGNIRIEELKEPETIISIINQ